MEDIELLSPGQRLKKIRKILNVNQEELAGKKFSKNYISMFENDKRKINIINAIYLSDKINKLAKQKGIDINVSASLFLKTEKDIAKDKCLEWLTYIESKNNISIYEINSKLYNVILLSTKYGLDEYKAKALFLKAENEFLRNHFNCAITLFLESVIYYSKLDDYISISDIYKYIGRILYNKGDFKEGLVYFNLAENMLTRNEDIDNSRMEDIKYRKALTFYKLGQYELANNIIQKISNINDKFLELSNKINDFIAS
ncbi:helix-turn-helix domain-containing protein [Caloranaerobacter azorensis]|uniref:Helix-turn-helix transcriptional regulator n=1 Tax=Caloranaerobacter azorensis TaxID=116090 RepID=A0A6P1YDV1_9FIRM|nr:helix-turn-helix transcriptional regulator [Caloranaerobacter azorensis]QIB27304.1 helix-turn-helix transcriptional regulator [Caloranaerobacter azorensis]